MLPEELANTRFSGSIFDFFLMHTVTNHAYCFSKSQLFLWLIIVFTNEYH